MRRSPLQSDDPPPTVPFRPPRLAMRIEDQEHPPPEDMEFDSEREDDFLEQLNVIGIKMDLHKCGLLYLRDLVI